MAEDPKLLLDKRSVRLFQLPGARTPRAIRYLPGWRQVYPDKTAAVYASCENVFEEKLPEKVKGPELGISGPALRELAVGGDSPPGMLSVLVRY
jgi:hypothetical protein